MFVDVHAHLDDKQFDGDIVDVISKAEAAGVKVIINNGIDVKSNRKTLELARRFDIIRPALGVFPGFAQGMGEDNLDEEIEFIVKNKPVAVGEVGLDYYHEHDKKRQVNAFEKFISIAERLDVPLIVHSRNAEKDVVDMLVSSRVKKIVLHCFCGKFKIAKIAEDQGFFFSIPPIVVNSKQFQEMVKKISMNNLLSETDSPYLSSVSGRRNEPCFVVDVVKKISKLKKLDEIKTKKLLFANFQRIF